MYMQHIRYVHSMISISMQIQLIITTNIITEKTFDAFEKYQEIPDVLISAIVCCCLQCLFGGAQRQLCGDKLDANENNNKNHGDRDR